MTFLICYPLRSCSYEAWSWLQKLGEFLKMVNVNL